MPVSCCHRDCKGPVPLALELERLCLAHFLSEVEQTCADMRLETAMGKAAAQRQDEIERYISDCGQKLLRAVTSGERLPFQSKNRVLSLFLTLMNLRENLDRQGKAAGKTSAS